MQNRLKKLEKLTVESCLSLDEIFEFRELNSKEGKSLTIPQQKEAPVTLQREKMKIRDMGTEQTQSFQNLTSVVVHRCHGLRYLFPSSVAASLRNLKELSISECERIEEIVLKPAENEKAEDYILFPQLCSLRLFCLPKIMSFSQGNYNLDWPSLEKVIYQSCTMQTFCLGLLNTPKLTALVTDEEQKFVWKGDLNTTIEYLNGKSLFLNPWK